MAGVGCSTSSGALEADEEVPAQGIRAVRRREALGVGEAAAGIGRSVQGSPVSVQERRHPGVTSANEAAGRIVLQPGGEEPSSICD